VHEKKLGHQVKSLLRAKTLGDEPMHMKPGKVSLGFKTDTHMNKVEMTLFYI
jgi:hypothetical protein